jgi:hypothetical protein
MRWFKRWYGANPLHLLTMIGCVPLAWYAGARLLHTKPVDVAVWFAGAVIGHDLILLPLYALADKSVITVFRHRPPKLPTVPWINYLRVPVVLSGILLLMWFPLIFKIPSHFPRYTDLSLDPYLGHWLTVTGALFLLSAVAFAFRLRPGRPQPVPEWADPPPRRPVAYDDDPAGPPQLLRDTQGWRDWADSPEPVYPPVPGRHRQAPGDGRQWQGDGRQRPGDQWRGDQWAEDQRPGSQWRGDGRERAGNGRQWSGEQRPGSQWQGDDRQWAEDQWPGDPRQRTGPGDQRSGDQRPGDQWPQDDRQWPEEDQWPGDGRGWPDDGRQWPGGR